MCFRVPRAEHSPIRRRVEGCPLRDFELRDGNGDPRALNQEFDLSQAKSLTGRQLGLSDSPVVHKGAIGRGTVTHHHSVIRQYELAMLGGNCGVLNLEVILRAAPKAIGAQVELYHTATKTGGFNYETSHSACSSARIDSALSQGCL